MTERPVVPTRVAHCGFTEHRFCGHLLFAELAGRVGFWSEVSLAAGGRLLERDEEAIFDDLCLCNAVADPRIWPLKMTRLGAAYGDATAGWCTGALFQAGAMVGGHAVGRAAVELAGLAAVLGEGAEDPARLRAAIEARLAEGARFAGFGVPFRDQDERLVAFRACLERRGRLGGRHWRLLDAVAEVMRERKGLMPNLGAAAAATCLDLGLPAPAAELMMMACIVPALFANAWEGAAQPAPALRSLPPQRVGYVGAAPRRSERATESTGPGPEGEPDERSGR